MTPPTATPIRMTLFAYGFRPFFLLAGWFAAIAIPLWVLSFMFGTGRAGVLPLSQWHAHEMLFGFVAAAIAGFMLTAVPSWTGSRGFGGRPLVLLTAAWLAGRLAMGLAFGLGFAIPFWLVAAAELLFLPGLAFLLAVPLLRSRNRNTPLLLVLVALWVADTVFLAAAYWRDAALAAQALLFTLNLVMLLVTIIGGRIVPTFTANALRARGEEVLLWKSAWLERGVILAMLAVLVTDLLAAATQLAGIVAGVAGLLQLARLAGWNGHRSLRDPIVWVLHAGYAWLPIGLLLKCALLVFHQAWGIHWQHALGAGCAAVMILAVMSRASLGHTGRPLRVAPVMGLSYGLLLLAVLLRVFGAALLPVDYAITIIAAAVAWFVAFAIYAAVYTPILLQPRVDGKPG